MFLRTFGNALLMMAALLLMLWSVWHLIFGKNGYLVMQDLEEKNFISQQQIDILQQDYDKLYHKINLLKANPPDLDLLEEQIRKILYYGQDDEVILQPQETELVIISSEE